MLESIVKNIPTISGVTVALLSFFGALLEFIKESRSERKDLIKTKDYLEIYSALPEGSSAKKSMESILEVQIKKIADKETRTINLTNIIAMIIVAIIGGWVSYLVASWALNTAGILSWILWCIFGFVFFFALGLSITGWASRYNKDTNSTEKE